MCAHKSLPVMEVGAVDSAAEGYLSSCVRCCFCSQTGGTGINVAQRQKLFNFFLQRPGSGPNMKEIHHASRKAGTFN